MIWTLNIDRFVIYYNDKKIKIIIFKLLNYYTNLLNLIYKYNDNLKLVIFLFYILINFLIIICNFSQNFLKLRFYNLKIH